MPLQMQTLCERFPLPPEGSGFDLFKDQISLNGHILHRIGVSYRISPDEELVGSAVGACEEQTALRAYFELIERISTVLAIRDAKSDPDLHFTELTRHTPLLSTAVFGDDSSKTWRYCRSNGIAAHTEESSAALAAHWELIERDRLLRSWYGETLPEKIPLPLSSPYLSALLTDYTLDTYTFGDGAVGIFGFPKRTDRIVLMGYGARETLESALQHATSELLQRFAFIGDTEPTANLPEIAPKGDVHFNYFLHQTGSERVAAWLRGDHYFRPSDEKPFVEANTTLGLPVIIDMTPNNWRSKLSVLKRLSSVRLPLTFGLGHPLVQIPEEQLVFWSIHPFA